jgi:hypothetical protein
MSLAETQPEERTRPLLALDLDLRHPAQLGGLAKQHVLPHLG